MNTQHNGEDLKREERSLAILRVVALIVSVAGALGSVSLTLWFGRRNPSYILKTLFAVWVLSPFVALVVAGMISKRWSVIIRKTLYWVMLGLTLVSLPTYFCYALWPRESTPAAVFLVVPLASWLLIIIIIAVSVLISRKTKNT